MSPQRAIEYTDLMKKMKIKKETLKRAGIIAGGAAVAAAIVLLLLLYIIRRSLRLFLRFIRCLRTEFLRTLRTSCFRTGGLLSCLRRELRRLCCGHLIDQKLIR